MRTARGLLAVAAAAAMLGGCQSFPLTSWMFKKAGPPSEQLPRPVLDAALALEEGKNELREGKVAAAVASFRVALVDPSTQGEANNGLAVAFAGLGRLDLAERYFQAALIAEPDNQKYLANLSRLQQQVLLARRKETSVAVANDQKSPRRPSEGRGQRTGPVERVSRTEVIVHALPDRAAPPAMVVASREVTPAREPAGDSGEKSAAQGSPAQDRALTLAVVD